MLLCGIAAQTSGVRAHGQVVISPAPCSPSLSSAEFFFGYTMFDSVERAIS